MLDIFLVILALSLGETEGSRASEAVPLGDVEITNAEPKTVARAAEDQTPSGKFLTATEVKPILTATKSSWVAVREWEGQDLVYFTHILAWRCGVYEIRYSVNGGEVLQWPVPECDPATATPGYIPPEANIYASFPLKSVENITIELLYDDLSVDSATYERMSILMP